MAGDWNGDGKTKIGIYYASPNSEGWWYLDYNGTGAWDTGVDRQYLFGGLASDVLVPGRW